MCLVLYVSGVDIDRGNGLTVFGTVVMGWDLVGSRLIPCWSLGEISSVGGLIRLIG